MKFLKKRLDFFSCLAHLACVFLQNRDCIWVMLVIPLPSPVQEHRRRWFSDWLSDDERGPGQLMFLCSFHFDSLSQNLPFLFPLLSQKCLFFVSQGFPRFYLMVFLASASAFKSILHNLARLTFCRHYFEQATSLLGDLHWPSLAHDTLQNLTSICLSKGLILPFSNQVCTRHDGSFHPPHSFRCGTWD